MTNDAAASRKLGRPKGSKNKPRMLPANVVDISHLLPTKAQRAENIARALILNRAHDRALVAAYAAKRRARKMSATPKWADLDAIKEIYKRAALLSVETGVQHVVDHIVPLQGRRVCGLHVECNLQVIPASENAKKYNHFDQEVEGMGSYRRHRFLVSATQFRPVKEPPGAWIVTGGTADEMRVLCEMPTAADVRDYWPDAREVDSTVPLDDPILSRPQGEKPWDLI